MMPALPTATPPATAAPTIGIPSTSAWILLLGALSGLLLIGHQLPPTLHSPLAASRATGPGQRPAAEHRAPATQPTGQPGGALAQQYATASAAAAPLAL